MKIDRRLNLEFFIARRTARATLENRSGVMARIAVVAVAVSVAAMLVSLAVMLGFRREVTARMIGFAAPVEVIDAAGVYAAESRPVVGDGAARGAAAFRRRRALGDALCAQERYRAHARGDGGGRAQGGRRQLRLVVLRRQADRRGGCRAWATRCARRSCCSRRARRACWTCMRATRSKCSS